MIGRGARRAIVLSGGHGRRRHRREEIQPRYARALPDRSAPWRYLKSSGERQPLPPDAKIGVSEISRHASCPTPKLSELPVVKKRPRLRRYLLAEGDPPFQRWVQPTAPQVPTTS